VTSDWHKIEIDWKAATTPGANDGLLTLWIDGVQKATVTNLDNDTRRVDGAQLGAVAGIDTGTRGTEYFDTFVSRRTTYIGLVAPGGIEVAKNPLPVQSQTDNGIRMAAFTQPRQSTPVGDALPVSLKSMLRPTGDLETRPITYTYDPLNRLTSAYYVDGSYFIYTYDAVGNRLTETTQSGTTTYTYDDANRLASVNGVAYTWDNNGNLLSDGTSTYAYDHANRLKSATAGGTTYSYTYNGLGDRVSQTAGGVTTYYILDLNAGLTQVLADGTYTYLYGNERIAQYGAGGPEYFLGDALGSVRQLVDGTGAITLTKSYEPFGDVLSSQGTGTSVYGFDAELLDPTGLVYLRARYLSTETGRFLNKDAWKGNIQIPASYNNWLFTYNNPINYYDPTGNWTCRSSDKNFDCKQWMNEMLNKLQNAKPVGYGAWIFFNTYDQLIQKYKGNGGVNIYFSGSGLLDIPAGSALTLASFDLCPFVNNYVTISAISIGSYYWSKPPDEEATAVFAHETAHLLQGFAISLSIQAEIAGYEVQYLVSREQNINPDNDLEK